MSAILSPRVDPASKLGQKPRPAILSNRLAKADGLTSADANMLATWLRGEGYDSVELVRDGERTSVIWQK